MSSFEKHAKDVAKSVYTAINQQSRELQARQQYSDRLVAELDTQIIEFTEQQTIDEMFKPPTRLHQDLALNLDICELVFAVLPYINGRSHIQAQLALTLLDNLVKNCGHPVHYQVATREFLNELFRRFPEYQPSMPNPVHYRILEMLQEWRQTLCKRSRHREDLQRINDMYSLLRRKGWHFPEVDVSNYAVVFGPEDTLRSKEELEKEDLEAMQAKLQELLRRATPRDLREANKLMKIITGYEQSSKQPDYDQEWESELESLQNMEPGSRMDDTTKELLAKCISNQSRIHKLIADHESAANDDGEDGDSVERQELDRLIRLNDTIGDAVQAYKDLDAGRVPEFKHTGGAAAAQAVPAKEEPESELIAVQLPWEDAASAQQQAAVNKNPLVDLMGLSFNEAAAPAAAAPLMPGQSTPGLTTMSFPPPPGQQRQPMSNPSLPATSEQARQSKISSGKKDVFDFSDLMSAAKDASKPASTFSPPAVPPKSNSPQNTNWGSAREPGKTQSNTDSLIDFL
ncbi:VHS-domain-containing protein [Linderina pennispora]|uniref:VHS-domain-containing protein n=1 Tax=Linderina pennispora TaxID=61395 RepID=A0A1Y1W2G8_9FUNG|nr:VHS-domain-containing protein [Linderina pennispora]ORX67750.1 VHS-domain-containing protein [Linderina pennispora]